MKILKILLIGLITTILHLSINLFFPMNAQSQLLPSQFVINGTLPILFSCYGLLAYSLIASMFLLVSKKLTGQKLFQGIEFGCFCAVIWCVYLLEPLPHLTLPDCIFCSLANALILIIMGAMCGMLLGENKKKQSQKSHVSLLSLLTIMSCFILMRYVLYLFYDIYSSFDEYPLTTLWWCIFSSFVIACAITWTNNCLDEKDILRRSLISGVILFGMNITLFNFFIPLIFKINVADLILRTISDTTAITIGCMISQKAASFVVQKG